MANEKKIICPLCGSDEISKPRLSGQAMAISVLLLGFPIPFMGKTYHCFGCGHDFKIKKNNANSISSSSDRLI